MSKIAETRRTGMCERASYKSLGRDFREDTAHHLNLQAAWIAARYSVGAAHARAIAEHMFARRPQR